MKAQGPAKAAAPEAADHNDGAEAAGCRKRGERRERRQLLPGRSKGHRSRVLWVWWGN